MTIVAGPGRHPSPSPGGGDDRGVATLLFVGVVSVALVAAMAVADAGVVLAGRARVSAAADAAALAAALALVDGTGEAGAAAAEAARRNGGEVVGRAVLDPGAATVEVRVRMRVRAHLLGTHTITARAKAALG